MRQWFDMGQGEIAAPAAKERAKKEIKKAEFARKER